MNDSETREATSKELVLSLREELDKLGKRVTALEKRGGWYSYSDAQRAAEEREREIALREAAECSRD